MLCMKAISCKKIATHLQVDLFKVNIPHDVCMDTERNTAEEEVNTSITPSQKSPLKVKSYNEECY